MPLIRSSLSSVTLVTTSRFSDLLAFLRVSCGNFSHHSVKLVRRMAATLSHSMRYGYWGCVAGSFWVKVKISALKPCDSRSFSLLIHLSGSSSSLSSHSSSWIAAALIHLPVTTTFFPSISRAGTLIHFPLTLISTLLPAMAWPRLQQIGRAHV